MCLKEKMNKTKFPRNLGYAQEIKTNDYELEGTEIKSNSLNSIFNEIMVENFPKVEKEIGF